MIEFNECAVTDIGFASNDEREQYLRELYSVMIAAPRDEQQAVVQCMAIGMLDRIESGGASE